jgi:serine/threonine protein phosphatase 1
MKAALPPGQRLYAIGDIHGRIDLLERLHGLIQRDAAAAGARDKTVVYLGDYVDRGPGSAAVVELLCGDPLPGFRSVCLKGNHEDLMLKALAQEIPEEDWFINGGLPTLDAYGVEVRAADGGFSMFSGGRERAAAPDGWHEEFARRLPAAHRAFYARLALSFASGGYFFVHAGVRPGVPLGRQHADDLIWIRDEFLYSTADHGAVVVHGHSIRPAVDIRPNRIGVDTGAWRSGRLSCVVLDGDDVSVLHT